MEAFYKNNIAGIQAFLTIHYIYIDNPPDLKLKRKLLDYGNPSPFRDNTRHSAMSIFL